MKSTKLTTNEIEIKLEDVAMKLSSITDILKKLSASLEGTSSDMVDILYGLGMIIDDQSNIIGDMALAIAQTQEQKAA